MTAPGLAALALLLLVEGLARGQDRPIVAVFDIEDTRDRRDRLSPQKLQSLTDYLGNKLAIEGKFKIVPRDSVRAAIQAKKKESFKECYDEACQIEIGKEIAAQKSLATKIDQLGEECIVTSTLFDLRQSATENSASYRGPCGRGDLLTAIEQIAARLRGETGAVAPKQGIRFDTSDLPAVPSLELPPGSEAAAAGVDFGDVDVDAMELFDAAVQGEKDDAVPVEQKIARWKRVKDRAPKYRGHATGRIAVWQEHAKRRQKVDAVLKKRAARMMQDWSKLSRLLKLKMISEEDKAAWSEAFYSAYEVEARDNPFARAPDVVGFLAAMTEKKRMAEEYARLAAQVLASIAWVPSRPAGVEFTRSEVTVAQYAACVQVGKCSTPIPGDGCNWGQAGKDNHPINCVRLSHAKDFCAWAGGRLPSEQEWQAEATNSGTREFPWGNEDVTCERAIWGDDDRTDGCGTGGTAAVCSKPRGNSVSGLCDMSGNVCEWTSTEVNSQPVYRGGAWMFLGFDSLSATERSRSLGDSNLGDNVLGFRCARPAR